MLFRIGVGNQVVAARFANHSKPAAAKLVIRSPLCHISNFSCGIKDWGFFSEKSHSCVFRQQICRMGANENTAKKYNDVTH